MKNVKKLMFLIGILALTSAFTANPVYDTPVGGAYLVFANKMGGEITLKELQQQCELQVDGCARGSRIFTYTLAITKAGETSYYQADSNELSAQMMAQLKGLSTGDQFEFKKIQAYLPNGKDSVDVFAKKFIVV